MPHDHFDDPTESVQGRSDPRAVARRHHDSAHFEKPKQIGPYKILDTLGEGGMGIVYLAEQTSPIHRRVALKIIKAGMDTRQATARFETEREALALMNHPNVARVFDAGATEQGRPYFAMEYVAGIPITDYCDKHRLNTEERLRLFMDVCNAVQHAHQKGIIHRDIKPSNVLVMVQDEKLVPKVIDFGVAKATQHRLSEETLFTEQGQLIGTPGYMSPEQAEMTALDIDTRTDVYSLGVLLYELLVGALPFDTEQLLRAGFGEIQRIIREVDPPKPSTKFSSLGDGSTAVAHNRHTEVRTLARQLRGDLDWIVMKCLEKDRTRRYDTANAVVMEIVRYLNNEPVLAGPPSAAYRVRKFVRRNQALVLTGSALFAMAVTGGSFSAWQAMRARQAERLSAARLLESQESADRLHVVNDFLQSMLTSGDPIAGGGREVTVQELVIEAARKIDEGAFRHKPAIETSLRCTLGTTLTHLGMYRDGEAHARKALEVCDQLPQSDCGCAHANLLIGRILQRRAEFTNSRPHLEKAVRAFRSFTDHEPDLSHALHELAWTEAQLAGPRAAEKLFHESITISKKLWGEENNALAQSYHALAAYVLEPQGKLSEAEGMCRKALEMKQKLYPAEGHPNIGECLSDLGRIVSKQRRYEEAEQLVREGLAMNWRLVGKYHPFTVESMRELGRLLRMTSRQNEAEALLREAADAMQASVGEGGIRARDARLEFAEILQQNGKVAEADALLRRSIDLSTAGDSGAHFLDSGALALLGYVLLETKEFERAELILRECVAIRKLVEPDDWKYSNAVSMLGEALAGQKKFQEAEPLLLDGFRSIQDKSESIPQEAQVVRVHQACDRIVKCYVSWNSAEPGKGYAEKAVEWRKKLDEMSKSPNIQKSKPEDGTEGNAEPPNPSAPGANADEGNGATRQQGNEENDRD